MFEKTKERRVRQRHRGANGDMAKFASAFLEARLKGFEKDMRICLTPMQSHDRPGSTHAYFPALMNCCGMLEYLAGFFNGWTRPCGLGQLNAYAETYLPQPDYDEDAMRVLFCALRHPVAHRGIASGVWVDRHAHHKGRRITWMIHADAIHPAVQIKQQAGVLKFDPPWPCCYTHRAHVHLGRLWRDIHESVLKPKGYRDALATDLPLLKNFTRYMESMYPR